MIWCEGWSINLTWAVKQFSELVNCCRLLNEVQTMRYVWSMIINQNYSAISAIKNNKIIFGDVSEQRRWPSGAPMAMLMLYYDDVLLTSQSIGIARVSINSALWRRTNYKLPVSDCTNLTLMITSPSFRLARPLLLGSRRERHWHVLDDWYRYRL
jgi:hypothetical protein